MTHEMVLKRTSSLVMPRHYIELDSDEMSYVEGGFYLDNTAVNNVMFYSLGVLALGTGALKLGWSWLSTKIAAGLASLIINLTISTAATVIGLVIAGAMAVTLLCYGVSFFEGIYTAQNKGTGVEMHISWFHLKKSYY